MEIVLTRLLNAHLPWIAMILIISFQSSTSGLKLPDLSFDFVDKFVHFFVFGILGWLIARGMYKTKNRFIHKRFLLLAIIIGTIFGLIDECHQSFVPGRQSDIGDWFADILGIITLSLFYKMKLQKIKIE
jgi:VanZ family protein